MVKMKEMTDKDFEAHKPYFGAGIHEVIIVSGEAGKASTGTDYIEFSLIGQNDEEGNVRLYLTDKTSERTRSILSAIAVHNKTDEAAKQKVRDWFKTVNDSDEMLKQAFLDKFKDMQAWIVTAEDKNSPKPNGGFYLRNNLYSYEPKPRATTMQQDMVDATPVTLSEIPF